MVFEYTFTLLYVSNVMQVQGSWRPTHSSILTFLVLSRIEYCAAIWASGDLPLLSQIQHNALRYFFGLGKTAPLAALTGDSGWVPLQMQLDYVVLKYWFRACSLPTNR